MALHALGKNKVQTALTMLGIVIGVSAVIAMVSLGQGAQKLVEQQVAGMGQNVLQVQGQNNWAGGGARGASDQSQALTEADVEAIRKEIPAVGKAVDLHRLANGLGQQRDPRLVARQLLEPRYLAGRPRRTGRLVQSVQPEPARPVAQHEEHPLGDLHDPVEHGEAPH